MPAAFHGKPAEGDRELAPAIETAGELESLPDATEDFAPKMDIHDEVKSPRSRCMFKARWRSRP